MATQIIAISLGPQEEEMKRDTLHAYFNGEGFNLVDENRGLFVNGESSFICSCFEQTQYVLFKEHNQDLPSLVFDFIFSLKDERETVISLGDEDEERWDIIQTDSEFTLKRFKRVWIKSEEEE